MVAPANSSSVGDQVSDCVEIERVLIGKVHDDGLREHVTQRVRLEFPNREFLVKNLREFDGQDIYAAEDDSLWSMMPFRS